MSNVLSIIGALLAMVWGIIHLFPTGNVVRGFGDINEDNKNIVRMEWINEGVTLIFLGMLVIISILVTGSAVVYISVSVMLMLIVLSIISFFTGFRIDFVPFKLCPVIFVTSALLIGAGILI